MKAKDFINAVEILEKERGIDKEVVVDALKEALEKAYKKNYDTDANVEVVIDPALGDIKIYEKKLVVDNLDDEETEIFVDEAKEIDEKYEIGDTVVTEINVDDFGRLAATHAKQVVRQKIREIEKDMVYNEYVNKKDDIIVGTIDRVEPNFAIIDLGKTGGILPVANQIPGERLRAGERIKVYVVDVDKSAKGAQVVVSRSDSGFLKRLFEAEVPDVFDGIVVIKSIAREAGDRSKVSVYTTQDGVDPIGSLIGPKGSRVQAISNEVHGEKIDIVEYNENPEIYITNTLAPSKVVAVNFDAETKSAVVIVPDDQLSLAIGKKGQNVRLAVRLTGFKIDIKSVSAAAEAGIDYTPIVQEIKEEVKVKKEKVAKQPILDQVEENIVVEDFAVEEDKEGPVVDIDSLLADIREVNTKKDIKIKKEKVKPKEEEKEKEITFLDVEKPKEEPIVPLYTEEELAAIREEEEKQKQLENEFYEEVDYDEFDKYYD